jgi:hypothetical protein
MDDDDDVWEQGWSVSYAVGCMCDVPYSFALCVYLYTTSPNTQLPARSVVLRSPFNEEVHSAMDDDDDGWEQGWSVSELQNEPDLRFHTGPLTGQTTVLLLLLCSNYCLSPLSRFCRTPQTLPAPGDYLSEL